jgi:hypothetical protein
MFKEDVKLDEFDFYKNKNNCSNPSSRHVCKSGLGNYRGILKSKPKTLRGCGKKFVSKYTI